MISIVDQNIIPTVMVKQGVIAWTLTKHPRDNLAARVKLYNDITALTRLAVARGSRAE
jgi:hypothetical protein